MTALKKAAESYDAAFAKVGQDSPQADVNSLLRQVEQVFTSRDGLPRRPWYRHLIYAPGFYTGYGVKTMPGVREAIEQGYWPEAEREIGRIAERLNAAAALIDQARGKMP